ERDLDPKRPDSPTYAAFHLTFRTGPGAERGGLIAEWDAAHSRFLLRAKPTATGAGGDAAALFLPARRALVDPVSLTRGNLVGMLVFRMVVRETPSPLRLTDVHREPPVTYGTPQTTLTFTGGDPGGKELKGLYAQVTSTNGKTSLFARILAGTDTTL